MSDNQCIHTIIKAQVGWHVAHFGSDDTVGLEPIIAWEIVRTQHPDELIEHNVIPITVQGTPGPGGNATATREIEDTPPMVVMKLRNPGPCKLGSFNISSGMMRVSDPVYDRSLEDAAVFKAKIGEWKAHAVTAALSGELGDCDCDFDRRVIQLSAHYAGFDSEQPQSEEIRESLGATDYWISVDTGIAGFFDDALYDEAIAELCDREIYRGIIKGMGVVSETGIGDGIYNVEVVTDKTGEAIAVLLVFVYDEDERPAEGTKIAWQR
jgi:hypothetical protein